MQSPHCSLAPNVSATTGEYPAELNVELASPNVLPTTSGDAFATAHVAGCHGQTRSVLRRTSFAC